MSIKNLHLILLVALLLLAIPSPSHQIQVSQDCIKSEVGSMNTCYLAMYALKNTRCYKLNDPSSQMNFYECQCDIMKKLYVCFNRPLCQNALDVQQMKTQVKGDSDNICKAAQTLGSNITTTLSDTYQDLSVLEGSGQEGNSSTSGNKYNDLNNDLSANKSNGLDTNDAISSASFSYRPFWF